MSELPSCIVQSPACGACGSDTEHDGDSFVCFDCGLNYGEGREDEPATFLDEELPACGKACDNSWHPTLGLTCGECKLPEGHKSDCWTDCKL
ncbi:hypothetical protein SEA_RENNA12_68 [Arthrobacter phage Renna12]|nr:hypothetical protein SEA_RENNA12_68 [Arthrobacter phage Renna12]